MLVGPNCLGVVDTTTGLQLAHAVLPTGDVAVLSQSGNLVLDLAGLLADRGLGVSRFVSLGNQADLGVVDFLHACVGHDGTRAIAVYTEDVVDGRAFLDAARALRDAGKPLVLLAPGRTEAAVRSAASHTGSLTSSSMVIDAACAAVGAHRVHHPTEMADLLVALRVPRRMAGPRAAILTDGGGHGAVAADALGAAGLRIPVLTGPVTDELEAALWAQATVTNPVDLAGAGEQDLASYARGVQTLLASDQVDGVLLTGYFGGYSTEQSNLTAPELAAAHQMADAVAAQGKPLVVQTIYPESPACQVLRAVGIPVHRDVDRACTVLAGLVEPATAGLAEELPVPAPPVTDTSYDAARALFADAGVEFPVAVSVTDAAGLEAAFDTLELPCRAQGDGTAAQVRGRRRGRRPRRPGRGARGVRRPGHATCPAGRLGGGPGRPRRRRRADRGQRARPEVRLGRHGRARRGLHRGARRHRLRHRAGVGRRRSGAPAVVAGGSGAPRRAGTCAGRPRRAGRAVARVSRLAAAHPELVELELNPVLASPAGVLALDARVVLG